MRSPSSSPSSPLTRLLTSGLALLLVGGIVACSDSLSPSADTSPSDPSATSATGSNALTPPAKLDASPRPKGGMKALQEAITYPEVVSEAGIEGRVFVEFVVDASGAVQEAKAIAPDGADAATHEDLQRAAVQAVERVSFTPGMKDGKAVKTKMTLPITFRLNDNGSSDQSSFGSDATESGSAPNRSAAAVRSTPNSESSENLFQKAGIQILKVLINANGDILLGRDPVDISSLASAVEQRITQDAARAVLIPDANAPQETVEAVQAQLRQAPLQKIYTRTTTDE